MKTDNKPTQCRMILHHLQAGKSLTQLEALPKFGCLRLGGRIHELRREGYNIQTEMVKVGRARVAKYSMVNKNETTDGR